MAVKPLAGKIAVVAGATRGAGRGIACGLGEAGAVVYCSGRSVRGRPATAGRPETIEETAEMVSARGGTGIAVQTDHTEEEQVEALFGRVREERGRLDVLVNDVWGGDELTEWGTPFWKLSMEKGLLMLRRAVWSHVLTSRHGGPLMVERGTGLIVEITDGDFLGYRGNLFYDLSKMGAIRLAYALAQDLRGHGVTALAVTPGFLRSEAMLDHFGVTEANWRDAASKDRHFAESETPFYVGRGVAALAADPHVHRKAAGVFASATLAREYGLRDVDGRQPDFGSYMERITREILDRGGPATPDERFLLLVRGYQLQFDPMRADEVRRIAAAVPPETQLFEGRTPVLEGKAEEPPVRPSRR